MAVADTSTLKDGLYQGLPRSMGWNVLKPSMPQNGCLKKGSDSQLWWPLLRAPQTVQANLLPSSWKILELEGVCLTHLPLDLKHSPCKFNDLSFKLSMDPNTTCRQILARAVEIHQVVRYAKNYTETEREGDRGSWHNSCAYECVHVHAHLHACLSQ